MTSSSLPNHLLAHRKRLALSQTEVAFLLGVHGGAKVCRDERFAREPSLATALAYEVIFQRPASELFAGLYQSIEQEVAARAKILTYRTATPKPNQRTAHKRQVLTNLADKRGKSTTN
jgi:transcriptional regulator with XRE-family HTH domain